MKTMQLLNDKMIHDSLFLLLLCTLSEVLSTKYYHDTIFLPRSNPLGNQVGEQLASPHTGEDILSKYPHHIPKCPVSTHW